MYPTSRFFGDALYGIVNGTPVLIHAYMRYVIRAPLEYSYDINFIECAEETAIQKRKEVLYQSYCDLVSYCMCIV